ncbi:putative germin-like protein 9-2 [Brachypodium distachyon]|uniref:Cupin type-1 domain-containing protein n=1 Tax=Brachypodium distachyon TaxID=15368 RepID=A0A2K2D338_BRADI|nr:putative germin-like protein 9-2 [Brachypodium distachyon]PNT68692.1 hypothetical protein BRADI_3g44300v3 [Brachypodium distachyon]|eukprot:XP_010235466.2 putative germin-like protein 9-2 [Brachypodium distachyon]
MVFCSKTKAYVLIYNVTLTQQPTEFRICNFDARCIIQVPALMDPTSGLDALTLCRKACQQGTKNTFLVPQPDPSPRPEKLLINCASSSSPWHSTGKAQRQASRHLNQTMAFNCYPLVFALLSLLSAAPLAIVLAGDPDILTDFVIPANANPANITGDFFTYTGFRVSSSTPITSSFTVTKATMMEFPALNGQSVSYARLTFPPGSVNPAHAHPRSAELLLVVDGALSVGFVDAAAGRLYTQDLAAGDMFVFPKGTVHYQYNMGGQDAVALSAFGSAAAGLVSVPVAVFETGIDDAVLAKSFKTDEATIQKLKAGLAFRCC